MNVSVEFKNVTKQYPMKTKETQKLKALIFSKNKKKCHNALNNISFKVKSGDVIGIIGRNGSGKSTLSNLIIGATSPTKGEIVINGTTSLIAISSGLNPNLSGLDNIELKGLMLGLTNKEIDKIKPDIIEFSELGDFIYQPVKTYSSGMKSKLGFAISVNINPDILVIDEALSVGDQSFYDKCIEKINSFKESGKTIFFVSHNLKQIEGFCQKVLWIKNGIIEEYAETNEVLEKYNLYLKELKLSKKGRK